MQILFQIDINSRSLDQVLPDFWDRVTVSGGDREFATELVKGVLTNMSSIDVLIQKYAENWDIGRMGLVDKNIMRVAIFEMLHRKDIPPAVSINEAVEVAKLFGTKGSPKFVNGILDSARGHIGREPRHTDTD